jgi:hypothetical protein
MARQHYVANDILVSLCATLNVDISSYITTLGGRTVFTPANYQLALTAAYNAIDGLLDDEDDTNDYLYDEYYGTLEGADFTDMYWSTEKAAWV